MAPSRPCNRADSCASCAGEGRPGPPLSFAVAGLLVLAASAPAAAADGVFLRVESQTYSEPVSIDAALNRWDGAFHGGEIQWSYNWAELGYRHRAWSLSALYRRDFWLDFSADAAELYYRTRHRLALQTGRRYAVDIAAYGFSARGLRAGWRHRFGADLTLAVGMSLFNAADLMQGHLQGQATALADNDYSYDAYVDYTYDEDRLFGRQVEAPDGLGASLDARLAYRPTPRLTLRARAVDLLGLIRWKDAPYTRATATSDRRGFDEEGYIIVEPAISGVEGYHSTYVQWLEPRLQLQAEQMLGERLSASLHYRYQFGQGLLGLGAGMAWGDGSLGLTAWPQLAALGLRLRRHGVAFGLTLDSLGRRDIRTLWLGIGINTGTP